MPRVGISVFGSALESMSTLANVADSAGLHSVWTSELYNRSASIALAAIATTTERCVIGSGIMYAVGRTPLMLAAEARDLDELSGGRLILGLGSGTRRMIGDWHGLDPDGPASRMEELVPLLRDLWRLNERPVDHDGRFYRVKIRALDDLAAEIRPIPIYTAGVGPRMIETAGRVADGLLGHSLFSPRYIEDVVRPAIERGVGRRGRDPADVGFTTFVLAAIDDDEEQARRDAAAMIAFYGSVKSYAGLFEVCGFGREAEAMRSAFAQGDVNAMIAAVSDDMVDELSAAGTARQVTDHLRRFDGLADEVILFPPAFRVAPARATKNARRLIEHCSPLRPVSP
jgi:probable F420-dependent oxidoreductase